MGRLTERKYGEIVSSKREKTQIHCSNFCNNCSQGAGNCGYVREMVEKLAEYEDAEEQGLLTKVVYGEWIDTEPEYHNGYYRNAHKCSNCQDYYTTEYGEMNYCPNCGAKMKTKEEAKQMKGE